MPPVQSFRQYEEPRKTRKILYSVLGVCIALVLILFVLAVSSVFRISRYMMSRPSKEFNHIAAHLMPAYDDTTFRSYVSELYLSSWFFKSKGPARGTVILVHNNGDNRMQFGLDTADLFNFLTNEHFNVFAFDLRHSGKSDGELSSYGLAEYRDVLDAMAQAEKLSGQRNFILYGIGSGVTASLLAWETLPELPPTAQERENNPGLSPFSRRDVKAVILDTPCASAYDYILADLNPHGFLNQYLYRPFVPPAIRLAAGSTGTVNLIPLATQIQAPMLITRNLPDSKIPQSSIDAFIDERTRLNAEMTSLSEVRQEGHLTAFNLDKEKYLEDMKSFLDLWFEK